MAMVMAISSIP